MMRSLMYPLEPTPHRIAVRRCDGEAAAAQSVVHFDDLNLAYPVDVRVLYRRIQAAAVSLCQPSAGVCTDVDSERIVSATVLAIQNAALIEHHRRMKASSPNIRVLQS